MRLINTETLDFEIFHDNIPRYAILSHTWGDEEVSFQEYSWLRENEREKREDPDGLSDLNPAQLRRSEARTRSIQSKAGYSKIRSCVDLVNTGEENQHNPIRFEFSNVDEDLYYATGVVKLTEGERQRTAPAEDAASKWRDNLHHLWVDTCCIDKSSSAELSEAINSMFSWYQHAWWCIAYLNDVSEVGTDLKQSLELGRSRWFTRGWTLQELLAPPQPAFYNRNWKFIGTRQQLATSISTITGIQLKHLAYGGMWSIPDKLASTMAWAAKRSTSRTEDIAYCLLGVFHVNMPLLYGEGFRAFQRLQQQILTQTGDFTLLAWGLNIPLQDQTLGSFALSPRDYEHCSALSTLIEADEEGRLGPVQVTSRGFQISLVVYHIRRGQYTSDVYYAFLPCTDGKRPNSQLALILAPRLEHSFPARNATIPMEMERLGITTVTAPAPDSSRHAIFLSSASWSSHYHGFRCIVEHAGLVCMEVYPPSRKMSRTDNGMTLGVPLEATENLILFLMRPYPSAQKTVQTGSEQGIILVMECLTGDKYSWPKCSRLRLFSLTSVLGDWLSLADLMLHKRSALHPDYWFGSHLEAKLSYSADKELFTPSYIRGGPAYVTFLFANLPEGTIFT